MTSYVKFMKEILNKKRKFGENEMVALIEEWWIIIQKKLPSKLKNSGSFTIPCIIGEKFYGKALCDLGARYHKISITPEDYDKATSMSPCEAFAVVLIPVTAGLILNTYAKSVVNIIRPIMSFLAMFCTALCIGSPLAINRSQILSSEGHLLLLPIVTFHVAAFALGYWASKLPFFRQEPVCRTISLCTGMQSSTLAGLLATQFLGSSQAVPAACSVVVMAIVGLSLASFWGSGSRIRDIPLLLFPETCSTTNS
ncbi:probable sodium/metabolite cotransporter BASS3, chloroplastic [Phalaenopsis equestris]|uniref:probable sodium/metabolite cotransporter BASS3, chloroplastic n=1 Tax=Phalaenopsis equestris TaxID=78828 RepID=UPI0009E6586F|nr:probable sodium/metabolite cotransporter BASS3, chloroplastic [Phalaenopsis equestris]